MFTGVHQHAIDAKGRTSLPSKFRDVLSAQGADRLWITQDLIDRCLKAYAPAQWAEFMKKVDALSQFDPGVRALRRTVIAPAQDCPVDKVGRILLPQPLRDFAGLGEEVVWAGQGGHIEVWSPAGWQKCQDAARAPEMQAELQKSLATLL